LGLVVLPASGLPLVLLHVVVWIAVLRRLAALGLLGDLRERRFAAGGGGGPPPAAGAMNEPSSR
jgi:hypothetical protein